jgi:hypothetical protein
MNTPLWICMVATMCAMLFSLYMTLRVSGDVRKTRNDLVLVRRRLDSVAKVVDARPNAAAAAAAAADRTVERLRPTNEPPGGFFHLGGYHTRASATSRYGK